MNKPPKKDTLEKFKTFFIGKNKDDPKPEKKVSDRHTFFIGFHKKPEKPKLESFSDFISKLNEDDAVKTFNGEPIAPGSENPLKPPKKKSTKPTSFSKLDKHLSKKYNAGRFTQEQKSALLSYSDSSHDLNHHLIDSHKNNADPAPSGSHYANHIPHIDAALKKTRTSHDMVVHSGVGFSPRVLGEGDGKKIRVHLPAYTSTSISKETARSFTKVDDKDEHSWFFKHYDGNGKLAWKHVSKADVEKSWNLRRETYKHLHTTPEYHQARKAYHDHLRSLGHHGHPSNSKVNNEFFEDGSSFDPFHHMISVHVPKGSHGNYMKPLNHKTYSSENEFLIHRNAKVDIHPTPRIHPPRLHPHKGWLNGIIEWRGKLVHDGVAPTRHAKKSKDSKTEE